MENLEKKITEAKKLITEGTNEVHTSKIKNLRNLGYKIYCSQCWNDNKELYTDTNICSLDWDELNFFIIHEEAKMPKLEFYTNSSSLSYEEEEERESYHRAGESHPLDFQIV